MEPGRSGCIVYRMNQDESRPDINVLAAAQQQAQELGLPLAVVGCVGQDEARRSPERVLAPFTLTESFLAELAIPLIVLVGDCEQRYEWFSSYTHPYRTWRRHDEGLAAELYPHPHPWPGVVISVAQLQSLLVDGTL